MTFFGDKKSLKSEDLKAFFDILMRVSDTILIFNLSNVAQANNSCQS
jgi:hypothetical protein